MAGSIIISNLGPTGHTGSTGAASSVTGPTGSNFNYTNVTASTINLSSNQGYLFDTTSNAITATLPSSPTVGQFINFSFQRAGSNNLTIARNGATINSIADDLLCDLSSVFSLIYVGGSVGWKFVPYSGVAVPNIKLYKATWSTSFANLETGNIIPFTTQVINTDPLVFGTITNPGNRTTQFFTIKEIGYYDISLSLHLFDLKAGIDLAVEIIKDIGAGFVVETGIIDFNSGQDDTDQILFGNTLMHVTVPNTKIAFRILHDQPGDNPYPSDTNSAPSQVIIKKLG